MIALTKLDGNAVIINIESIKYLETIPDTLIQFLNGDSLIVKESIEDVQEKVVQLHAEIFRRGGAQTPSPAQ